MNQTFFLIFKKFLSITFLFIAFSIIHPHLAQAQATDCTQYGGSLNCIDSYDYWLFGGNAVEPSFEVGAQDTLNSVCSSGSYFFCYLQEPGGSFPDVPCSHGSVYCNAVTLKNPNNMNGVTAFTLSSSDGTSYLQDVNGNIQHNFSCPKNYTLVFPDPNYGYTLCEPPYPVKNVGCPACKAKESGNMVPMPPAFIFTMQNPAGEPFNTASGVKSYIETDYYYDSAYPLTFTRYYNNLNNNWTNEYQKSLAYSNNVINNVATPIVILSRPEGNSLSFTLNNGVWVNYNLDQDNQGNLTQDGNNNFIYTTSDGEQETYTNITVGPLTNDSKFKYSSLIKTGGAVFSFLYSDGVNLSGVTDPFGNTMTINLSDSVYCSHTYNVPVSITGPDNKTVSYTYDSSCNLIKVTYADGTNKQYSVNYDQLGLLGSVTNENNMIVDTTNYRYNSSRNLSYIVSQTGEGSSADINSINATYGTNNTVLTDGLGNTVTLSVVSVNSQFKISGFDKYCSFCGGIQGSSFTFNTNGYATSYNDFQDNPSTTNITYTNDNLVNSMTENAGGTLERTTTYTYTN